MNRDIFLSISLILLGIKYLFGLSTYTDIMLYDESNYLYNGVYLLKEGFPDIHNAPLYALWYFILSLIPQELTSLYFLNHTIISIVLPLSLFIALRSKEVSSIASFTIAVFVLLSAGNLIVPLVGQFALIIILISLIFYEKDLLPLQIGALCATLVRPEFILTLILLLIYGRKKLNFYILLSSLVLFLVIVFNPSDRSFFAFSQHFSLNWVSWNHSLLSPWTNYDIIMQENFGDAGSIISAFLSNPLLFIKHILENVVSIGKVSSEVLKHSFILSAWEVFAFIGLIVFASRKYTFDKTIIPIILLLIPSFISLILIYPRKHYLFIVFVLLFCILLILFKKQTKDKIQHWIPIIVVLFFVFPQASQLVDQNTQPYLTTINFLKSLEIKEEVNLLEADGGYNIYLGENFKRVAEYDKDCEFDKFLKKRNINMIVVSGKLLNFNAFKEDPQWIAFLNNPHPFKVYKIPSANRYLFVK